MECPGKKNIFHVAEKTRGEKSMFRPSFLRQLAERYALLVTEENLICRFFSVYSLYIFSRISLSINENQIPSSRSEEEKKRALDWRPPDRP